jgi:hypothetical protein
MLTYLVPWSALIGSAAILPLWIERRSLRNLFAGLLPLSGLALLAIQWNQSAPWKLLASSLLFLYVMKGSVLLVSGAKLPRTSLLLFMSIWPGMKPSDLLEKRPPSAQAAKGFVGGLLACYLGVASILALSLSYPNVPASLVGWLGIAALLTTVHFGFAQVLTAMVRLAGWPVGPLFDKPLASASLADFWTKRWNLPFVEMDRILFFTPLSRRFGIKGAVFGIFLISGLLHEMAISYPVNGGWGGPLIYFVIQGLFVLGERRLKLCSWLLTWAVVLAPLPLLFHAPFRETLVVPLFELLHGALVSRPMNLYVEWLLIALGVGHFLILLASYRVPRELGWAEDLPKLRPFNRKLMWVYGAFTVLTIVAFGTLTLALRSSFLGGEPAAIGLAAFISVFWAARIGVDFLYFKHEDWPKGPEFVVGHALLTSLFAFLALGYGLLALSPLLL